MNDTFIYNHNFQDYSVELELELEVYNPRRQYNDDVAEIDILSAKINEEVEGYKVGQNFDISLLDYDDVASKYFNQ